MALDKSASTKLPRFPFEKHVIGARLEGFGVLLTNTFWKRLVLDAPQDKSGVDDSLVSVSNYEA